MRIARELDISNLTISPSPSADYNQIPGPFSLADEGMLKKFFAKCRIQRHSDGKTKYNI